MAFDDIPQSPPRDFGKNINNVFRSLAVERGNERWTFPNGDDFAAAQAAWSLMLHYFTKRKELHVPSMSPDDGLSLVKMRFPRDGCDFECLPLHSTEDYTAIGSLWKQVPFRNHTVINTLVTHRHTTIEAHEIIRSDLPVDVLLELYKRGSETCFNIKYTPSMVSLRHAELISGAFRHALEMVDFLSGSKLLLKEITPTEGRPVDGLTASRPQKLSRCLHDLVEEKVLSQPTRLAVLAHDGRYTYSELWAAVSRLASRLIQQGACPEARAAILMEKSVHYPVAVLAVLKSGAAFVPLDPTHPMQRLKQLVQDVEPFVILSTPSFSHVAHELATNVWVVEDGQAQNFQDHSTAVQLPNPNNAAYIMFTSGSTGKPKGVIVEHASFATSAMARGRVTGLGPHSRVLQYAAHTFDVSVDEILTTLIHGGCVCVPSETDRFDIYRAIERMQVNHALLTPTSARMLDPDHVPSLATLQLGGEPLSEEINDKWSNHVRLFNVYGPTEASVASVMNDRTGQKGSGHVIGLPVGTVCFIVDAEDHNRLLLPDRVGELVIGGHTLARGYLDDTGKTDAFFIRSPFWVSWTESDYPVRFYKTGDLASMDSNGLITLHGRKDNQVKLRGQRINVEEIELALSSSEHINSVIVDLPNEGPLKNKLTAILPQGSHHQSVEVIGSPYSWSSKAKLLSNDLISELHGSLQSAIPLTMIPSIWITLPCLPQNSSSKTDRKQLRTWLEAMDQSTFLSLFRRDPEMDAKTVPVQQGSMEAKLEDIWCQVLNLPHEQIRPDQSFIRNGGDSITAMELRSLAKDIGISLKISDILSADSIKALFRCSSRVSAKMDPHLEEETRNPFPLSPTQQFYFDHTAEGTELFTQEVCLEVKYPATEPVIRSAIRALVSRHSMLRARFCRSSTDWLQWIAEDDEQSYSMSTHVLRPGEDLQLLISSRLSSLSAVAGPVFDALLVERDSKNRVLILSAHHLVVDFVSWRILLQDLEDLIRGNKLHSATIPFQSWCRLQAEFTKTLDAAQILRHPLNPNNQTFWAPGNESLQNIYGKVEELNFSISVSETKALIDQCSNVHGTRPVEIMLATLFRAFTMVFPDRETPNVFIESHGREPWEPFIDVSRTVGWFTTAYPLVVPAEQARELGSAISYTQKQRRSFADNGHSYWCCRHLTETGRSLFGKNQSMEFVFNFAGQYQRLDREDSVFRRLSGVGEEKAHPQAARLSNFDILVSTEAERLHFKITFPRAIRHRDRVDDLIRTWKRTLVAVALDSLRVGKTIPSSADDSDTLKHDFGPNGMNTFRDAQDVFCVSELQQHMLHSQAQNPLYYKVVGTWKLETRNPKSRIDQMRLRNAWKQVVESHANLRTVFPRSANSHEFFGVVLKSFDPTIVSAVEANIDSMETRRMEPFSTTGSLHPPHGMEIIEADNGSVLLRLEFSHAIIDATSRDILLNELFDAYAGLPITSGGSRYQHYLDQLSPSRPAKGIREIPRCIFPTDVHGEGSQERILSVAVPPLSADIDPFDVCRLLGITFSSIIFTAWSLVLSKYADSNDVCFAYTVSNRPRNVPGIEKAVGCYIKLLVCSVEWSKQTLVWDIAQRIQSQCADCISGDTQFAEATEHPQNGRSGGLLNTMVNVRNTAANTSGVHSKQLIVSLESFEDPWNYDIVLCVNRPKADGSNITVDYRSTRISEDLATRVAHDLNITLNALFMDTDITRHTWDCITQRQNLN